MAGVVTPADIAQETLVVLGLNRWKYMWVREATVPCPSRRGRPPVKNFIDGRMVGFAVLSRTAKRDRGFYRRRIFWVRNGDPLLPQLPETAICPQCCMERQVGRSPLLCLLHGCPRAVLDDADDGPPVVSHIHTPDVWDPEWGEQLARKRKRRIAESVREPSENFHTPVARRELTFPVLPPWAIKAKDQFEKQSGQINFFTKEKPQ